MGSMTLLGCGRPPSTALPGPPTFTYQAVANGSTSGNVLSIGSTAIGTQTATRFVVAMVWIDNFNAVTLNAGGAVFNAAGTPITATAVKLGTDSSSSKLEQYVLYAVVPTGGTNITLDMTFSGAMTFNQIKAFFYTADSSTFASLTPTTAYNSSASGTSITTPVVTSTGSAVLALCTLFGGSSVSFTTPNDPPVAQDGAFGSSIAGHANNVASSAASQVSATWTTSAQGSVGLAAFR